MKPSRTVCRRRRLPAGDRQQQCDVRSGIRSAAYNCRLLDLLAQKLAADDFHWLGDFG